MNEPLTHRPVRVLAAPPDPQSVTGTLVAILRKIPDVDVEIADGRSPRAVRRRLQRAEETRLVVGPAPAVASASGEVWLTLDPAHPVSEAALASASVVVCPDEPSRAALEKSHPATIGRTVPASHGPVLAMLTRRRPDGPALGVVGVVGYDHGFIRPLLDILDGLDGTRVDAYEWPKFAVHDPERTAQVLAGSDVVLAEWCGPNAVEAARAKRPDQRLVVHLHRFELERGVWRDLDEAAVDLMVVPGPHYRRLVLEATGWPSTKVFHVPNMVDSVALRRPKLPDVRHTVGMLGASSPRKRLDLALEVLAALRRIDPRYRLAVKSADPRRQRWVWDRPEAREFFLAAERRMEAPDLAGAIMWEGPGPDVARWFQQVGVILSVSDDESFHLAPAEGMASGAVPAVRAWPGAAGIYDDRWIHADLDELVQAVAAATADEASWAAEAERARLQAARWAPERVAPRWLEHLATS